MYNRRPFILLFFSIFFFTACITEDMPSNTNKGNIEACWRLLDEHYCFFKLKKELYGLDWNEVHQRYTHAVDNNTSNRQLFETLRKMICELRDGHVNLISSYDIARYGEWFDNYPTNFSDSLLRHTLGPTTEHHSIGGLQYRILPSNIGYIRVPGFNVVFGNGMLNDMILHLSHCNGLIIDVRNNGGGMITSAEKLASLFINEKRKVGYICHKTGKGHNDFSPIKAIYLHPFNDLRWQKRVCVLTNRRTFSAANTFVSYMHSLPLCTTVGDVTGGGGGLPFSSELPNGWGLRFSACPTFDINKKSIEEGIAPDYAVNISSEDYRNDRDAILLRAISILTSND